MAVFNATNATVVGDATKKVHYDRVFDNVLAVKQGDVTHDAFSVNAPGKFQHSAGFEGNRIEVGTMSPGGVATVGWYANIRGGTNLVANTLAFRAFTIAHTGTSIVFGTNRSAATAGATYDPQATANAAFSVAASSGVTTHYADIALNGVGRAVRADLDSAFIDVCGGSGGAQSAGAFIRLSGNSYASPGLVNIYAGNVAGSLVGIVRSDGTYGMQLSGANGATSWASTASQHHVFNNTHANGGYLEFQHSGTPRSYIGSAFALVGGGSVNDYAIRSETGVYLNIGGVLNQSVRFISTALFPQSALTLGRSQNPWGTSYFTGTLTFTDGTNGTNGLVAPLTTAATDNRSVVIAGAAVATRTRCGFVTAYGNQFGSSLGGYVAVELGEFNGASFVVKRDNSDVSFRVIGRNSAGGNGGIITGDHQPMVDAYNDGVQNIGTTPVKLTFNTEVTDSAGCFASGTFTVPVDGDGKYTVVGSTPHTGANTGVCKLHIRRTPSGGSIGTVRTAHCPYRGDGTVTNVVIAKIALGAGDTIELWGESNNASQINFGVSSDPPSATRIQILKGW